MQAPVRVNIHDLGTDLRDDGQREEIVDGEYLVSKQPHAVHQMVCHRTAYRLEQWNELTGEGVVIPAPGVLFSTEDAVAPDIIWIRQPPGGSVYGDDGKIHVAPDLVVEVLSPGAENERRDRQLKLKLYAVRGVREYWLIDWLTNTIQVYRNQSGQFVLGAELGRGATLRSDVLAGFSASVTDLCNPPGR